jgi:hypothetical protein
LTEFCTPSVERQLELWSLCALTAQTTLLTNQQTLTSLQVQEMTASVQLIESLGGGWDRSQLPSPAAVTQKPAKSETTIQQ